MYIYIYTLIVCGLATTNGNIDAVGEDAMRKTVGEGLCGGVHAVGDGAM